MNEDILKQQEDYFGRYLKIKNNPRYKKIWKYIRENSLKGKILDVGCCNGEFSEPLVRDDFDCYGLEFMNEMIEE